MRSKSEAQKGPKTPWQGQQNARVPQSVQRARAIQPRQAPSGEPSAKEAAQLPAMGGEGEARVVEVGAEVEGVEVEEGADGGKGVRMVVRQVDGALGALAEGRGYERRERAADEGEAGFVNLERGGGGGEGEGEDGVAGGEGVELLGVGEEKAFFGDEKVVVERPVAAGDWAEGLWDSVVDGHGGVWM